MNLPKKPAPSSWISGKIIARNVASMLTSNVVIRATNLVMYVMVARYLGVHKFGQLSLAVLLFYAFHRVCLLGLPTLITRQVAKDREATNTYFFNASSVVAATSITGILAAMLFTKVMDYSEQTAAIVVMMCWSLLPFCLAQVCEGVFKAWEKMQFIAYANVPLALLRLIAVYLLLTSSWDVQHVVMVIVASHWLILFLEWSFLLWFFSVSRFEFELQRATSMVRSALPFFGIQGMQAINSCVTVVFLSKFSGETSVGLYNAAAQLLIPLGLVFDNVVGSLFPRMCIGYESGLKSLEKIAQRLIEFFAAWALPSVVGLFFLAQPVLTLLYHKPEFGQAVIILQILVWLPLQNVLTKVMGQTLWAAHRENTAFKIRAVNLVFAIVLGLLLISQFGLIGAAVTSTLVAAINVLQHCYYVSRLFDGLRVLRNAWKPILPTVCMGLWLFVCRDANLTLAILSASVLYAVLFLAVLVWTGGGLNELRSNYQRMWL